MGGFEVEKKVFQVVETLGAGEGVVDFGVVWTRWEFDWGDGNDGCAAEEALDLVCVDWAFPGSEDEEVAGFGCAPGWFADGLEFGAGADEFGEWGDETADEGGARWIGRHRDLGPPHRLSAGFPFLEWPSDLGLPGSDGRPGLPGVIEERS
jgi:hypothetical protein